MPVPRKNLTDVYHLFASRFTFKNVKRITARDGDGFTFDVYDLSAARKLGVVYDDGGGRGTQLDFDRAEDLRSWESVFQEMGDWLIKSPFSRELQPISLELSLSFIGEVLLLRKKYPQNKGVVVVLEADSEDQILTYKSEDTAAIRSIIRMRHASKGRISWVYENPLEGA